MYVFADKSIVVEWRNVQLNDENYRKFSIFILQKIFCGRNMV